MAWLLCPACLWQEHYNSHNGYQRKKRHANIYKRFCAKRRQKFKINQPFDFSHHETHSEGKSPEAPQWSSRLLVNKLF